MNRIPSAARAAITIGACLLVFFITREIYRDGSTPPAENGTVLMEEVRKVLKLVTVEGEFSELYSREDSWVYQDWLARLPGFKKRIMLRVKARVSIGYDLSDHRITLDDRTHTVRLELPADPQVLAVEHDIDYYDIDEGVFNHFSPDELTAINAAAKKRIVEKVREGRLFRQAAEQRAEVTTLLRALVERKGWTLEVVPVDIPGRLAPQER